MYYTYALTLS